MSIKRHIFSYTLYAGVSIYVESFIGLLISILISRQLSPDELGVYSLLLWISGLGVAIANGGLTTAAIKFLAESRGTETVPDSRSILSWAFKMQMLFLPLALCATLLFVFFLADRIVEEKYTLLLIAVVLAIAPKSMQMFYISVIKGFESFKSIFFVNIIVTPLNLITVVAVILMDGGIEEFVLAYLAISLIYFAISWYFSRKMVHAAPVKKQPIPTEHKQRLNTFVKFATLNAVFMFFLGYGIEIVFLNWYATAAEAGYYAIGFRLAEALITMIPGVFSFILLPVMARSQGTGNHLLAHRYRESGRFLVIMAAPFFAFGVVFSDLIIRTLYGPGFEQAVMPLRTLLLFFSFSMLNGLAISIMLSMEKQRILLIILACSVFANIVLDIVLIKLFGLSGAVAASVISTLGFSIACQLTASRLLNTYLPYFGYLKIFAMSYLLLVPLGVLHHLTSSTLFVLFGGTVYFLLYLFLIILLFKLSREEVSIIHSYIEKVPVLKSVFSEKLYLWIDSRYEEKYG